MSLYAQCTHSASRITKKLPTTIVRKVSIIQQTLQQAVYIERAGLNAVL
jgi:hypothetical protein